jgi:hypothetical protein
LFFVSIISYLMIFLLILIRDLDNPFGYYERYSGADVSLKPLIDTVSRLAQVASAEASLFKGSAEQRMHPTEG